MSISSSGRLTGIFESKALGIIKSVGGASIVHRVEPAELKRGRCGVGGSTPEAQSVCIARLGMRRSRLCYPHNT